MVITDRNGVVEWSNTAFSKLSGYSAEESLGMRLWDPTHTDADAATAVSDKEMWAAILAGSVWRGELTSPRRDGSRYLQERTVTPVKDERGEIAHFIAIEEDLTDRRLLERQLQQSQKMETVGQLAGGVAHDFNNLLTVINATADIAAADLPEGDPLREEFREIRLAGERAATLTRQLLAFSRKQVLQPAVLNVNTVVGEHGADVGPPDRREHPAGVHAGSGSRERQGGCRTARAGRDESGGECPRRHARRRHVDRVDAQRHAGRQLRRQQPHLHPRAHTCSWRSPTTARAWTRRPDAGSSSRSSPPRASARARDWACLPCSASCSRAVAASRSTAKWAGVRRSRCTCPRWTRRQTRARSQALRRWLAAPRRSLWSKTMPAVRRVATRVLRGAGYTVLTANNGLQALALLKARPGPVDLVLTDMVMPGMGGRGAGRRPRGGAAPPEGPLHLRVHRRHPPARWAAQLQRPFHRQAVLGGIELARKVREVLDHDVG